MQTRADIVIVGGGIAGASIAYHLARLGRKDVVVLDQGPLIGGTTSHAPGLVGQLRTNPSLVRMLMYSVSLYRTLRLDGVAGYVGEGSLRLASSKARWNHLQAQAPAVTKLGLQAHLISAAEAARMIPLIDPQGVEGALYLPDDGSANAPVLAGALIKEAQAQGVQFHAGAKVQAVEIAEGRVQAVQTTHGRVATETLVIAAGIWSPRVGRLAGVAIPLTPMQHQYVVTPPLPELRQHLVPNLRDPDNLFYLRQRDDTLVLGGYEHHPKPFDVEAIPERPDPTIQTYDAAQLKTILDGARRRVPCLRVPSSGAGQGTGEFAKQVNGLESFTPDGEFLLGPAPETKGVWVACGFCAHGVSGGGGVGKVMAEWIVNGDPGMDMASMSLDRFRNRPLSPENIRQAACRIYGTYYDIAHS